MEQARQIEPDSPDVIVASGQLEMEEGRLALVEQRAREALELEAGHADVVVLIGHCLLRRGQVEDACEHAVWVLSQDATDTDALYLLAAVKARSSVWLGLWWRLNSWVSERGERGAILILVGAYVVYRVLRQLAVDADAEPLTNLITFAWLGLCLYSWVGPALFRRALQKELGQVSLADDF